MSASTNDYELQDWLRDMGQPIALDGIAGQATRNAIMAVFVNTSAPAITSAEEQAFADRLGVSLKQVRAVAKVESAGGGFDNSGRPKILFERHIMHRLTGGIYSTTAWSNPSGGGYSESSWDKLTNAACADFWAAFSSASWGKFQIMGMHWQSLGYQSPRAMAYGMTRSEAAHYEALVRFIEKNGLKDEMRAISTNPDANRPFCKAYNGPNYEQNDYHNKLAREMA